jgi:hypothetical protein
MDLVNGNIEKYNEYLLNNNIEITLDNYFKEIYTWTIKNNNFDDLKTGYDTYDKSLELNLEYINNYLLDKKNPNEFIIEFNKLEQYGIFNYYKYDNDGNKTYEVYDYNNDDIEKELKSEQLIENKDFKLINEVYKVTYSGLIKCFMMTISDKTIKYRLHHALCEKWYKYYKDYQLSYKENIIDILKKELKKLEEKIKEDIKEEIEEEIENNCIIA